MQFTSNVIKGKGIGRKLGYPTINISPSDLDVKLNHGVYICNCKVLNEEYLGALFFGPRLTFNESSEVLEIFLIDYSGEDLYGVEIEVKISDKIRDIKKFDNKEDLANQIKDDIDTVKISVKRS